ncbi:MAG TPA: recombination mediator RecR [Verrucomicrobiales bacterium]|nr:recombination mediator RecR [Verrucomicrobiales bacterium]
MTGKRAEYPAALRELIDALKRLPGIGPRSAERIALWLLQAGDSAAASLAQSLATAREELRPCSSCGFLAGKEGCPICGDPRRDAGVLCVVERAPDVLALERTGAFEGRYHVLGGRLSPLNHCGPEDLRLRELVDRVREEPVGEVILALGLDVEGEATANYIADLLKPMAVRLTRLAQGLPAGAGLDGSDQVTLARALDRRFAWGGGDS